MNSKDLNKLPVIGIAEGEQFGTVARAYLDAATKRVVGFAFSAGGGLLAPDSEPKLDTADIQSLGSGALTLSDRAAVRGEETNRRFGELVEVNDLVHRPVLTEGGVAVGRVASVDFDEHGFALQAIEVTPGVFKHNTTIPADRVRSIGPDFVIVAGVAGGDDDAGEPAAERRWVVEETDPATT